MALFLFKIWANIGKKEKNDVDDIYSIFYTKAFYPTIFKIYDIIKLKIIFIFPVTYNKLQFNF